MSFVDIYYEIACCTSGRTDTTTCYLIID